MTPPIMDHCPICRARLEGDGPCRRCRAELGSVRKTAERSAALVSAALKDLTGGDRTAALRKLRRASTLRNTQDVVLLLSALADK